MRNEYAGPFVLMVSGDEPAQSDQQTGISSVIVDLVEADPSSAGASDVDPLVLTHAPSIVSGIVSAALADGYRMQIEVCAPDVLAVPEVTDCGDVNTCERILKAARSSVKLHRHREIYPMDIWAIPRSSEAMVEDAVRLARSQKADLSLFSYAISVGARRISVLPSFLIVAANVGEGRAQSIRWLQIAANGAELTVDWQLDPP